ncbi:MAG: peptidoglycan-associated lipoprotein Pal [Candidatus Rokuibacteriota bacterium]|jgi:peptidoglycan-associated lipoprotein
MSTIPVLALLVLLVSAAGCGTAKSSQPDLAASPREPSPAVAATEPPDEGALTPTGSPPPPQEFIPAARLADIYFAFDAHEIRAEDTRVLDENAAWLRATPNALVLIEGHTDERGTSEYNLGLGDLRARAAMTYLMAHGVPAVRMVAISYGKERPICTEHDESCWARNRRAHFLVKLL